MPEIQSPNTDKYTPAERIECDELGCRDRADYRFEAHWPEDLPLPLYACLVHVPWALTQLQAYRIDGQAALYLSQSSLEDDK